MDWKLVGRAIICALVVTATPAMAGPGLQPPDDVHVKALAGKRFVDAKGFEGLVELGLPLPYLRDRIGVGREPGMLWGFWYVYDKGPWKLSVVARPDYERCRHLYRVEALVLEGAKAPATSKGIRIGDSRAQVEAAYGDAPGHLDELLDSRGVSKTTYLMPGAQVPDDRERKAFDSSVREGYWYRDAGMLFTFEANKVSRIITLFELDPVPIWLRDVPDPAQPWLAVVKDGLLDPTFEHPEEGLAMKGNVLLPPAPAVTPVLMADLEIAAPDGWRREGDGWVAPGGDERLDIRREAPEEGETPEAWFDFVESFTGNVLTERVQRAVPGSLLARMGADAGRTFHHQKRLSDDEPWPLRTWVLLLAKDKRLYRVSVSRRVHRWDPSPDGMELARRIFRSVKLLP